MTIPDTNSAINNSLNTPEVVMQLVTQLNQLVDEQDELAKARMLPRRELVLPIVIQLLDANKNPCCQTLHAVSLDISFGGIAFLCPLHDPNACFALVQFAESLGKHRPLVVDIKNQKMLGAFCKIGGVFDVNWADSIDLL